MTETDLAVFGNGAGNTEGLKTDTDICGSGSGGFIAGALSLFESDGRAYGVSPLCVFKADRLCFLNGGVGVNAVFCAYILALVNRRDTVIFKNAENLCLASLITFKLCHYTVPPYSSRGSMYLTAPSSLLKRP